MLCFGSSFLKAQTDLKIHHCKTHANFPENKNKSIEIIFGKALPPTCAERERYKYGYRDRNIKKN